MLQKQPPDIFMVKSMSKSAEKNTLLSVSYLALPTLLLLAAAVLWLTRAPAGPTTAAGGGAVATLAAHADGAVGGDNRALGRLVQMVRTQAPGGVAGDAARTIIASDQRLRA